MSVQLNNLLRNALHFCSFYSLAFQSNPYRHRTLSPDLPARSRSGTLARISSRNVVSSVVRT